MHGPGIKIIRKSLSHVCSAVKTQSNCKSRYYYQVHEDSNPELLKRARHNAHSVNKLYFCDECFHQFFSEFVIILPATEIQFTWVPSVKWQKWFILYLLSYSFLGVKVWFSILCIKTTIDQYKISNKNIGT